MATQLYTIREFLALFAGNEFVIALIFFNWLILGGVGTRLAYLADRRARPPSLKGLVWLSLAAAGLPAVHLAAIRLLRDAFFIHGSAVGFYSIFTYTLFTVAPYSILIGFVLPYSLFVLRHVSPAYPGALIYITDNAGDITGGALFSFVLIFFLTPMQAVLVTGCLLLAATMLLLRLTPKPRYAAGIASLLVLGALMTGAVIEKSTLSPAAGTLAEYRESRYGRLLVQESAGQHTLFLDGMPVASSGTRRTAEEAAHYALAQIDTPRRVLLISGVSGIMTEIQKYNPKRVDYVEIDPLLTRLMFKYRLLKKIPGLNVIHKDARLVLSGSKKTYNAVIACLPEPETFQLNRYYTRSFFRQVKQHLAADGVFSFFLEGVANYVGEADRRKISSVYNTVSRYFAHVTLLPGENLFFVCADQPISTAIPALLRQKKIDTTYIANYFAGNVTPERIDSVNALIDTQTPINRDTRPTLMKLMFDRWFTRFDSSPAPLYVAAALFLLGYFYFIRGYEFVLFTTGFINMATEILTLFAFQIFFGYIYFQIGLIVTVFLAGLLPGAWLGENSRWQGRSLIMTLDGLLVVLLGIFLAAVSLAGSQLPVMFYLIFGFAVSCVCGFQFPAILHYAGDVNKQATAAFSADLIGAAFGALLASVLLIPYTGLMGAAVILMATKTVSFFVTGKNQ